MTTDTFLLIVAMSAFGVFAGGLAVGYVVGFIGRRK